jgi:hypothetical protein
MLCDPSGSVDVVSVATPPLSVPVPIGLPPLVKFTVSPSAGVPKVEVTVAVKVTSCPNFEGVPDVMREVTVLAGNFFTT